MGRLKWILPVFVLLLIVVRIWLPTYITDRINESLSEIGSYSGSIVDVDLQLWRGAYNIDSLRIVHTQNDVEEAFVTCPEIDLSLEWKSLFKGKIVGEVVADQLMVNFKLAESEKQTQTGTSADWVQVVQDLIPIEINRFQVKNGHLLVSYTTGELLQEADLEEVELEMTNIRNIIRQEEALPSEIMFRAYEQTFGGEVRLDAQADLIRDFPNFDYNAELNGIKLTELNPIFNEFAKMDFESGSLDLYSEMAVREKKLKGYFKPVLEDVRIFKLVEEDRSFLSTVKEALAEIGQEVLERPGTDESATKINYTGELGDLNGNYWRALVIALRNAYWEALKKQIDHSINYGDVEVLNEITQSDDSD